MYVLMFHKRVEFCHVLIRIFLLLRINFLVFEYKFYRNNFSIYCFEYVHS